VPEDGAIESAFSHRLHYQHAFDETWRIRLIGSQITRKVGNVRLGLEMFNDLNRTTDFGDWEEQGHQIGPVIKFKVGNLSVFGSYLIGASSSAEDDNFRVLLTYAL